MSLINRRASALNNQRKKRLKILILHLDHLKRQVTSHRLAILSVATGLWLSSGFPASRNTLSMSANGAQAAQPQPLTDQERRGRQIYLRGTSASGKPITAVLSGGEAEVPASALSCSSCHSRSGTGTAEGGVIPSNLTWEWLTRPYDVASPSGRSHGPYNEGTFKRAVTMGLDPAGNELQSAMPRFRMSLEDAADLVSYIRRLGHTLDPGLTERAIIVAMITPAQGPLSEVGGTAIGAVRAYFEDLNANGGIYGRTLEIRPAAYVTNDDARRFVAEQNAFAFVSPLIAGTEKELLPLFEENEIPIIGPVTYLSPRASGIGRYTFYLYPGLDEQTRALCQFAAHRLDARGIALVVPAHGLADGQAATFRQSCTSLNLKVVAEILLEGTVEADRLAHQLSEAGADTVLFLGSARDTVELTAAGARTGWHPNLLLIGSLEGQEAFDIPVSFKGKTFAAYPTLPSDWSPDRLEFFMGLAEKHRLSGKHITSQIWALGAAEVFVEGLRRAGRDLSREGLVDQIEQLNSYDTGLTPRITYGPTRRVGALGAYVVAVNPAAGRTLEERKVWVPLE